MDDSADELFKDLSRLGIRRQPGMAAEMMAELAPLLAAQGIDLNDPNPSFTAADLNAAMGQAIEQRNFFLFAPVEPHRTLALQLLAEFSTQIAATDFARAACTRRALGHDPAQHRGRAHQAHRPARRL